MSHYSDEEEDAADAALAFQQEREHEQWLEQQEEINRAKWKAQIDEAMELLKKDEEAFHEWLKSLEVKHDNSSN